MIDAQIKAIFFDLDGTLVDSIPDLAFAVDQSLQALGYPVAGEQRVRLWVGQGAKKLVQQALGFALGKAPERVTEDESRTAHQLFLRFYGQAAHQSRLYPHVLTTLQVLKQQGLRLALITNKPQQFLPDLLNHLQLNGMFELILGGDSLSQCKPHPAPLLFAMEKMQVTTEQCLMVGDSANDVFAAQAAGIKAVCVTYGYNHGDDPYALPADWHINDFSLLIK